MVTHTLRVPFGTLESPLDNDTTAGASGSTALRIVRTANRAAVPHAARRGRGSSAANSSLPSLSRSPHEGGVCGVPDSESQAYDALPLTLCPCSPSPHGLDRVGGAAGSSPGTSCRRSGSDSISSLRVVVLQDHDTNDSPSPIPALRPANRALSRLVEKCFSVQRRRTSSVMPMPLSLHTPGRPGRVAPCPQHDLALPRRRRNQRLPSSFQESGVGSQESAKKPLTPDS